MTESAFWRPAAVSDVPSIGSTAMSQAGPRPLPTCSPLKSIGASSFSPSPMTITPSKLTVLRNARIASTAAPSAASFAPRPTNGTARMAAASVARTSSRARFRSGCRGLMSPVMLTMSFSLASASETIHRGFARPTDAKLWRFLTDRRS